jgi:L-lactate dehydrogenase complex protein LldG
VGSDEARAQILGKLRDATKKGLDFGGHDKAGQAHASASVVRIDVDTNLKARFVSEVERVRGVVHQTNSATGALETLRQLLTDRKTHEVLCWDEAHLPLAGVHGMLSRAGIARIEGDNAVVERAGAGITGCDTAIAATGTLVLRSGRGRSRMASLMPPVHIALVRESQLIATLEDWMAAQYASDLRDIRDASNITLITGCSRTADIEMSPVFGVHGPLEFHVVLF